MEGYALLYKIEQYSEKIYTFKPYNIVFGIYDAQNNIFLDEENNELPCLSDQIPNTDICVSEPMSEEELLKTFKETKNIEEAKKLLLEEAKNILLFGAIENNKLIIQNVITNEYDDEQLYNESLNDESYKKLKEMTGISNDITIFSKEEIEKIMSIDDLEQLKNTILSIMNHKEEYYDKYEKATDTIVLVVTDSVVTKLINSQNVENIKNNLKDAYDTAVRLNNTLSVKCKIGYNQVIFSKSKEEIDNILEIISCNYKNVIYILPQLDLTEKEYNYCNKVLSAQVAIIEKLVNEIDNVDDIIVEYKNAYYNAENAINEISDILYKKGLTFEEKELESIEHISENNNDSKLNLDFDYLKIYNKMISKVIGRNKQIETLLSTIKMVDNNPNPDKKHSCIIAGTTGTGKTQTFKELERLLPNRPVVVVDTNQITQQGYTGGTIEDQILGALLDKAHIINASEQYTEEDLVLAKHGIVFLDEIDKRKATYSSGPDVNGQGVIDQLLKLMDGTNYKVTRGTKNFKFDTSNLVIFAGGAFQEYFEQEDKKIGYGSSAGENFFKYDEVDPEELVKYGLNSQFIGRFDSVLLYPPHTEETLLYLETNKPTSYIESIKELFKTKNVDLVWEEEFIEKVAQKAHKLKKGGRGIGQIVSRCTNDAYSEIEKYPDTYKTVFLTEEGLENPGKVILIRNDKSFILMEDVKKRNELEATKKYDDNKVLVNTKALMEAKKYKMALQAPKTTELALVKTKTLHL